MGLDAGVISDDNGDSGEKTVIYHDAATTSSSVVV